MKAGAKYPTKFCADPYHYTRRPTRVVMVGEVGVGGVNPVRIQSMTTVSTMDTEATVAQIIRLAEAGCEIVRVTVPTVKEAQNLENIRTGLIQKGCRVPLVADIHFRPDAAHLAAEFVEKVRINPGNYSDSKAFRKRDYSDSEYRDELKRIEERFTPLVLKLKTLQKALRIGTNHGSLSDRILNRYGDTPLGMTESVLEFVRVCRKNKYHDMVLSIKASSPRVMVAANRFLVSRMAEEDMDYPLHLGVTEAGLGDEGRLKSAIGIGSLLQDGIGDTIRVSLTEEPEKEIPVARDLLQACGVRITKAEFISCPSCGRTLFDIQDAVSRIKARTSHLKGVKIAVMGCIVNGPGEMADADFGFVGGGPGKINLYVGQKCVQKSIPVSEAEDRLIGLIKSSGKWIEL